MNTQPEATELAEVLESYRMPSMDARVLAAAELRRLHASCEDYAQHKQRQDQRVLALTAQRDALLEALVKCRDRFFPADQPEQDRDELWGPVNAAIKAVEGEKE